jgi:hypothetical protein
VLPLPVAFGHWQPRPCQWPYRPTDQYPRDGPSTHDLHETRECARVDTIPTIDSNRIRAPAHAFHSVSNLRVEWRVGKFVLSLLTEGVQSEVIAARRERAKVNDETSSSRHRVLIGSKPQISRPKAACQLSPRHARQLEGSAKAASSRDARLQAYAVAPPAPHERSAATAERERREAAWALWPWPD